MKKNLCLFVVAVMVFAAVPCFAEMAVGMLENASMHSFTVHTDDGECLDFARDENLEVNGGDGLVIGDRVVVDYYYDDYESADLLEADSVTVLDTVIGTVKSATMDNVTIETEDDGITLTFAEDDDTEIIGKKGVTVGKKVEIAYEGGLAIASDVQSVKVWEVFSEDAVSGTIEMLSDDELHLKSKGGTYVFDIARAYIDHEDQLREGNNATVNFFGKLDPHAEIQQVAVHSVYASEPDLEQHSISGTVKDITMHQITVHTARGNNYSFRITQSTKLGGGDQGINVGDTVKCYYKGDLGDKAHLDKVTVLQRYEEPKPEPDPDTSKHKHVTGKVIDASMNVLTIKSGKHTYLLSIAEGYKNDLAEGLVVGEKVKVFYTGNLKNSKKLQKVTVTRIADA